MRLIIARIAGGLVAGTLAFGAAALPARVAAQALPPYAMPATVPNGYETIHGVIEAIQGTYRILVRDDRGFIDSVSLHPGTVINPRGLRLRPGMIVTISGYASGSTFAADAIDSPSQYDDGARGGAYYSSSPDYGYGYGGYYYPDVPVQTTTVIVQQAGPNPSPTPSARRGIEPPHANRPVRRPLDGKADQPPVLPPYAIPANAYRGTAIPDHGRTALDRAWSSPDRSQPSSPQSRAPAPEPRAAPPPPPPQRSEPPPRSEPPARENKEPAKPH
jgi:hypothetical protein